jgi:hypothetical protein
LQFCRNRRASTFLFVASLAVLEDSLHGVSKSCFKLTIGQAESILDPRALSLTVRPWARAREIAEGPVSISNAVLSGEVFKLKTSVFVKR